MAIIASSFFYFVLGDKLTWDQQFRFRHATTRMYLAVDEESNVILVKESRDPRTVFKLHPVIQDTEEVTFESYARIEHVLSGNWLHALKGIAGLCISFLY